jgi:hypothetical protein
MQEMELAAPNLDLHKPSIAQSGTEGVASLGWL